MPVNKTLSLFIAAIACSVSFASANADVIVGTGFTGRTISGTTATIVDYTLDGVDSPGSWTVNNAGSLMNSSDAQNNFAPADNAPSWDVLVPIVVQGSNISLSDVTIIFQCFSNAQATKVGINGQNFAPNHDAQVSLLDSSQVLIDQQSLNAWTTAGINSEAAYWTGVFDFVSDDNLIAGNTYYIKIALTGSSGNNVGLDSFTLNGSVVPEPSSLALLGLGGLLIARRRKG